MYAFVDRVSYFGHTLGRFSVSSSTVSLDILLRHQGNGRIMNVGESVMSSSGKERKHGYGQSVTFVVLLLLKLQVKGGIK